MNRMQKKVVDQLIALNETFYQQTAKNFDESRQHAWPGWQMLLSKYSKSIFGEVLDIGCGNGRFGEYLLESIATTTSYTGIDSNQHLLEEAQKKMAHHQKSQFIQLDVLSAVNTNALAEISRKNHFQLVVAFGFLHHVPDKKLRENLFTTISQSLTSSGLFVFTTWQFLAFERLRKKIVDPSEAGIQASDLEEGDYVLDWKRGQHALRYCHAFTPTEVESLLFIAKLELITTFMADGKEGTVNQYYVCKSRGVE